MSRSASFIFAKNGEKTGAAAATTGLRYRRGLGNLGPGACGSWAAGSPCSTCWQRVDVDLRGKTSRVSNKVRLPQETIRSLLSSDWRPLATATIPSRTWLSALCTKQQIPGPFGLRHPLCRRGLLPADAPASASTGPVHGQLEQQTRTSPGGRGVPSCRSRCNTVSTLQHIRYAGGGGREQAVAVDRTPQGLAGLRRRAVDDMVDS